MRYLPTRSFFRGVFLFLLCAIACTPSAHAAEFTSTTLRLERLSANTSSGGLLCGRVSTPGVGTEDKISITFPSDFTVNSTLSNWTVSTTDLPAGTSAWPGINTAESISGRTVTFPSSDIANSGVTYCFHFAGTNTLTTGSAGTGKIISIATKTSANATIDQSTYKINILSSDEVTLTARVGASSDDLVATIKKNSPADNTFRQHTEIVYELSYGSLLPYATDLVLQAAWSLGTIAGNPVPSVPILDYKIGSANSGYNLTVPIVDLINRTITWSFDNFPANTTGQLVTFILKTNQSYTEREDVHFTVSTNASDPDATTPDSSLTSTYRYNYKPATNEPGSTPTPAPAPQAPVDRFFFTNVGLTSVSSNEATVAVGTSKPAKVTVRYGTSPTRLLQSITSLQTSASHSILLSELQEDTPYYFRLTAIDNTGRVITSDIFTFRSAKKSAPPKVAKDTLIATSEKIVLFAHHFNLRKKETIVLPNDTSFELQFSLNDRRMVKDIQMLIRDKKVLGINSLIGIAAANTEAVEMLEIEGGVFAGRLLSKKQGEYEVYARISDYNGNITEEKIASLQVASKFLVLNEAKKPVENAKVTLYLYNARNKMYEIVDPSALPIRNPSYSEANGVVPFVLPQGKYKAEVHSLGRKDTTVEFTIGPFAHEGYPTVHMQNAAFSPLVAIEYVISAVTDGFDLLKDFLETIVVSGRFKNLNVLFVIFCFVTLTLTSFSARIHIPLHHFPHYIFRHKKYHDAEAEEVCRLIGTILDGEKDIPLTGADIYLIDPDSNKIRYHTTSDHQGKFCFAKVPDHAYLIEVSKIDYIPMRFTKPRNKLSVTLSIQKHDHPASLMQNAVWVTRNVMHVLFELLLFISLALELLYIYTFGLASVLPFLMATLFNLYLWLHHLQHERILNEAK